MSKKTNWKTVLNLVENRKHKMISSKECYKNVKSRLVFFCFDCQTYFRTTWASYKQASKTGCPTCKKQRISDFQKNKLVSKETKQKISTANQGKQGSLLGKTGQKHPRWKGGTYDRLKGSSNDAYVWRKKIK